jgi:hypothetical protein
MSILSNIFEGYFNLLRFSLCKKYREKQEKLFTYRLKICEKCIYFRKSTRQCIICSCIIEAKTKVIYKLDKNGISISGCPKRYW